MSMRTLAMRQRLKIILLLSAGGVATATTAYRMVKNIQFLGSTDLTKDFTILSIFTLLELSIGLACACLPSVNVLVRTLQNRSSGAHRNPNVPRTSSPSRRLNNRHCETSANLTTLRWLSKVSKSTMTSIQPSPYGETRDHSSRGSTMVHTDVNEGLPRRGSGYEADLAISCGSPIEKCLSGTEGSTIDPKHDEEARGY
ncbi:hypothetical protein M406DRAFT_330377 [Cryphonectria parasitica EP155]|uniref:Rhodopsin domain-containing protein n=1 Tax=Cryphonectria parasitica (strain ATCC 38755 / EP155) TaxID=660469 RepID=A0A9P4Y575_CRYP1|nr:uncharacterized protein M406DRAFT_330377 [Cryphonectria parasitica EP155]KAF3766572.1 hypothetical protein M406DRAFT_330377 [Cryphonectria parasitica EP155]